MYGLAAQRWRAAAALRPGEAEPHFLGWRDEIDPDELFESGRAWGLKVVRRTGA